jgi:hypothetical protein
VTSTDRFVALLGLLIAALGLTGAGLRYLIMISWQMGRLVNRMDDHIKESSATKIDFENRIRAVERKRR